MKLKTKEILEQTLNALIFCGLIAIAIGFSSWLIGLLQRYEVAWEAMAIMLGLILMIFAFIGAKLLSKIN